MAATTPLLGPNSSGADLHQRLSELGKPRKGLYKKSDLWLWVLMEETKLGPHSPEAELQRWCKELGLVEDYQRWAWRPDKPMKKELWEMILNAESGRSSEERVALRARIEAAQVPAPLGPDSTTADLQKRASLLGLGTWGTKQEIWQRIKTEELSTLNVWDIRERLKSLDLPLYGTKEELWERLRQGEADKKYRRRMEKTRKKREYVRTTRGESMEAPATAALPASSSSKPPSTRRKQQEQPQQQSQDDRVVDPEGNGEDADVSNTASSSDAARPSDDPETASLGRPSKLPRLESDNSSALSHTDEPPSKGRVLILQHPSKRRGGEMGAAASSAAGAVEQATAAQAQGTAATRERSRSRDRLEAAAVAGASMANKTSTGQQILMEYLEGLWVHSHERVGIVVVEGLRVLFKGTDETHYLRKDDDGLVWMQGWYACPQDSTFDKIVWKHASSAGGAATILCTWEMLTELKKVELAQAFMDDKRITPGISLESITDLPCLAWDLEEDGELVSRLEVGVEGPERAVFDDYR